MPALGLIEMPPRVEGDALADQRIGFVVFARALPLAARSGAACSPSPGRRRAARPCRACACRSSSRTSQVTPAWSRASFCACVGDVCGRADIRRQVAELAREAHAVGDRAMPARSAAVSASAAAANASAPNSGVFCLVAESRGLNVAVYLYTCASVASAAVRSFHALSLPGTSSSVRYDTALSIGSPFSARAASAIRACKARGVEFLRFAEADDEHARCADVRQREQQLRRAGLAADIGGLDQALDRTAGLSSSMRAAAALKCAFVEQADDDAGRAAGFRGLLGQTELEGHCVTVVSVLKKEAAGPRARGDDPTRLQLRPI